MLLRFTTEFRAQQEWAWLLAIWLFLGGSGSGLFILSQIFPLPPPFAMLALALVLFGSVILLLELGSPLRAWRAFFRIGTSWLSRGVGFVVLFVGCAFLWLAPNFAPFAWLAPLFSGIVGKALPWIAALSAVMIMLYPAFFFRSTSRAIPFWSSPLLPVLFLSYAVLGAAGIVLLTSIYVTADLQQIGLVTIVFIPITLLLVIAYLHATSRSGGAAGESVRILNRAPLGWVFWLGVIGVGLFIPALLIFFVQWTAAAPFAGGGILIGSLLFRYCVLKAGVYAPLAPAAGGPDWSKLNRSSAEFQREYASMVAQVAARAQ